MKKYMLILILLLNSLLFGLNIQDDNHIIAIEETSNIGTSHLESFMPLDNNNQLDMWVPPLIVVCIIILNILILHSHYINLIKRLSSMIAVFFQSNYVDKALL
ncbi:hypothetical protein V1503_22920 [Bacillus sp. SCS-151]|uniref:hypothetical protein n=1 Tax=Nanhaiella sioensis TaxID=3115293 RepID=UPI00397A8AA6